MPCGRVPLEKLVVAQLVDKLPAFVEPEASLPCSQQPATGPSREPGEFGPHLLTPFP